MGDSANIRFQCSHCSKGLRVAAKVAGRRVKCPNPACGQPIEVPLPLDDKPAPPPLRPRPAGRPPGKPHANGAESAAPRPVPRSRRPRWPWYAGGGVAVLCVVASVVFVIAMSGKDRTKAAGAPGDGNGSTVQVSLPVRDRTNASGTPSDGNGASGDVNKKDPEPLQTGGLTKEKLLGEWEGALKDGSFIALKFVEKGVVVSILGSGINRGKAREAADWVSASDVRSLVGGKKTAESLEAARWASHNLVPALGGGFSIGWTAYKVDAEKNEVQFGLFYRFPEPTAVAKPTTDGALLVSGVLKTADFSCTVPETRIEQVKPGPQAKTPQVQLPGEKEAGGLTKEKLLGEWKGKIENGSIKVSFTDNKGGLETAPEWRVVSVWVDLSGGGFAVEGMAYKIDTAANEVKIPDLAGNTTVVKPTKDGALVFSGRLRVGGGVFTFADTRLERVKPGAGAKLPPAPPPGEVDATPLAKDGPGDPALTYDAVNKNTAKYRGKRVTWAFVPCSTDGKRMMCALDMKEAMGPRHAGIYVVEFPSQEEAGRAFRSAAFKAGSTITGTIAGEVEQFLVVRDPGGEPQKDIPKVTVPLLVHPKYAVGEGERGAGKKGKE